MTVEGNKENLYVRRPPTFYAIQWTGTQESALEILHAVGRKIGTVDLDDGLRIRLSIDGKVVPLEHYILVGEYDALSDAPFPVSVVSPFTLERDFRKYDGNA